MIQTRTQTNISQAERTAFAEWFKLNPEYDSVENGEQLSNFLLNTWNVEISEESLAAAKQKLIEAGLLVPLSRVVIRLKEIVADYPAEQLSMFNDWFEKQKTLVNGHNDQAFENAANLLTELRGRTDINAQRIHEAIGRLQYRGTNLHWAQAPKSDRPPEFRMGLRNHAADASEHKPGVLFSKDEMDDRPFYERVGHKADKPEQPQNSTPAAPPDAWTKILEQYRGAGRSHAQKEQIEAIYSGTLQPREKVQRIERILNPQLFQVMR